MPLILLILYQTIIFSTLLIAKVLLENFSESLFQINSITSFFISIFSYVLSLFFLIYLYKRYHFILFKRKISTSILSFLLSFLLMFLFLSIIEGHLME